MSVELGKDEIGMRVLRWLSLAVALAAGWQHAVAGDILEGSTAPDGIRSADMRESAPLFGGAGTVREVAGWAVTTGDNRNLPFAVIDKNAARLFIYDAQGVQQASTPVLLGLGRGDYTAPGVGLRPIATLKPEERTTPAGRYVAEPGKNISGEDILWIDYDTALAIHRVRPGPRGERRLERLASPSTADNYISYGCVNVPVKFYDQIVSPTFARKGIVYILPASASAQKALLRTRS